MYEWYEVPLREPFGRFVQFCKEDPEKIEYYDGKGPLLGITTIQSTITSDDPEEWKYSYMCSEVGDRFLKEHNLAVGIKQYDQFLELSYIKTQPYKTYKTVPNQAIDPKLKYEKRTNRKEWVRVSLIGKVIVRDNGECVPGQYCMPNVTDLNIDAGIAIPWNGSNTIRFYILRRLTKNTIEIVNAPLLNHIQTNATWEVKTTE